MRRLVAMLLTFTLCLQMTGQLTVTAAVSSEEEAGKEICRTNWIDDFEADTIAKYKVAGPDNGAWGNWQIVDGKLQVTGNPGANWWGTSLLLKDRIYDDFVMEFDADVSAGYGVILKAQDDAAMQNSGLNKWFSGDAYVIMHWAPVESNASVQILDFDGTSGGRVLANVGNVGAMTLAHWKIIADGNTISIQVTDNQHSENTIRYVLTDDTYSAGYIGFYNLTCAGVTSLKVDNLSIKATTITEPEAKIAWTDDMNGSLGANYTAYGLWWNNAVSAITQTDYTGVLGNEGGSTGGISYYYLNHYKFEDFVMEFDVVSASEKAQYGVMLRTGNPGAGADQGEGYTVMYDGSWVFAGRLDGRFTQITSTPSAYAYNPSDHGVTITHWKVVCVGENIAVYFNHSSEPAIWVTDTAYKSGSIGFRTYAPANTAKNVMIDNLSVKGTGTAPEQEDPSQGANKFSGMTLSLDGKIGFNFYINSNNTLSNEAYVEFVLPKDGTQIVTKEKAVETENGLRFTCLVPAKEMADKIDVTLYDGGQVMDTKSISVRDYAEILIANKDNNAAYAAATMLVKSMLHYGAYAQKLFGYRTEDLADKNYTADDTVENVSAVQLAGFAKERQGKEGFGSLAGATLILEGETTLRMFFAFDKDTSLEGLKFTVNGEERAYKTSGDYYVVEFANIAADDLDQDYTVKVTAGENTFDATCSAMTSCYNALVNSDDIALQNAAKALYLYHTEAKAYFK